MEIAKKENYSRHRFEFLDAIFLLILLVFAIIIVVPFISVIATSFATQKEALESTLLLIPKRPTIDNYYRLFQDPRIVIGYKTTSLILLIGVPLNMFLTTSLAYGLSRTNYPGAKFMFYAILLTMLFNGGIVPLYLLMLELGIANTLWSVILAYGVNTFYFIIMRTYMPHYLKLGRISKIDGAGEWRILFRIILPISKPILATVLLFYSVDRWNEWFNAMIFLRRKDLIPLQLVLRNIVMDSSIMDSLSIAGPRIPRFTEGIQSATIMVVMVPVMCFFPFLQKYFVKGIMIGAVRLNEGQWMAKVIPSCALIFFSLV